jgi:hypothetical protein
MLERWRSEVERNPALGETETAKKIVKDGIERVAKYERIYGLDETKAGVGEFEMDDNNGSLAFRPRTEEDVRDERVKVEDVDMD